MLLTWSMRFNAKELSLIACQPRERFDKEGVLFVKEKQEGLFRKGEGVYCGVILAVLSKNTQKPALPIVINPIILL